MLSENSKENRNKWYRDHVNKYCVCVNKNDVEVVKTHVREGVVVRIDNREKFTAYKHKNFSFYVKNKIKEDLEKRK